MAFLNCRNGEKFMDKALKRENLKEKIILSTFQYVKSNGLEALSIREISKHLGINIASINYYFAGKENLLTEVFKHYWLKRTKEIDELAEKELSTDPFNSERFFSNVYDLFISAPEEVAFVLKSMLNSRMKDKNDNFKSVFESSFPTPPGTNAFKEILIKELGKDTEEEKIHFIIHNLHSLLYMNTAILYSNVVGNNPDHPKDHKMLGVQSLKENFLKVVKILMASR